MVKVHNIQMRSQPPLFCNFQLFNIKAPVVHHPFIQKEVQELSAKGVIEPSFGGAGFCSNVFVVPMNLGGLWLILHLKQFNNYIFIPTFKMPTINRYNKLIYSLNIYILKNLASGGSWIHICHIEDKHLNQLDHQGLFSINVLNPKDYVWPNGLDHHCGHFVLRYPSSFIISLDVLIVLKHKNFKTVLQTGVANYSMIWLWFLNWS